MAETKNIYQKLNEARFALKQRTIKGSGKNEYAGFTYLQLEDILPEITKIEHELGIMTTISFNTEVAVAKVVNCEKTDEYIEFTSPMSSASLKGCHEVQNLGAVETYLRRYLYMIVYEIVEQDVLDKTAGSSKTNKVLLCADCGKPIKPYKKMSAEQFSAYTTQTFGRPLCYECGVKTNEATKAKNITEAIKEETNAEN